MMILMDDSLAHVHCQLAVPIQEVQCPLCSEVESKGVEVFMQ